MWHKSGDTEANQIQENCYIESVARADERSTNEIDNISTQDLIKEEEREILSEESNIEDSEKSDMEIFIV